MMITVSCESLLNLRLNSECIIIQRNKLLFHVEKKKYYGRLYILVPFFLNIGTG